MAVCRRFVLQTEISSKYIQLFVFYLISVSISSPCRKDQFAVFTFYLKICTDPDLRKIRHSSLVFRCGFAVIIDLLPF